MHNSYFTGRIYVEKTPGKVVNGTSTQVGAQMINKWRVKMTPKKIYKVEDSP